MGLVKEAGEWREKRFKRQPCEQAGWSKSYGLCQLEIRDERLLDRNVRDFAVVGCQRMHAIASQRGGVEVVLVADGFADLPLIIFKISNIIPRRLEER
jgi:hypothetical protein